MNEEERAREVHRRSKRIFLTVTALDPRDRLPFALLLAREDPEVASEVKSLLDAAERERDGDSHPFRVPATS